MLFFSTTLSLTSIIFYLFAHSFIHLFSFVCFVFVFSKLISSSHLLFYLLVDDININRILCLSQMFTSHVSLFFFSSFLDVSSLYSLHSLTHVHPDQQQRCKLLPHSNLALERVIVDVVKSNLPNTRIYIIFENIEKFVTSLL
jgi:hypothetical protein